MATVESAPGGGGEAGEATVATPLSTTTEKSKQGILKTANNKMNTIIEDTSKFSKIPKMGVAAIFMAIIIVICGVVFFCVRRFFRKRRGKDGKKGMKGVDLKSVQLLGSAYKEKVT